MNSKQMTIGIKSLGESFEEFRHVAAKARRGDKVTLAKDEVNFVSLEAFQKFFTPRRMEVLRFVHHRHPQSVYILAKGLNRALRNVQDDVSMLARVGLLELQHTREGRSRTIPRFPYGKLALEVVL